VSPSPADGYLGASLSRRFRFMHPPPRVRSLAILTSQANNFISSLSDGTFHGFTGVMSIELVSMVALRGCTVNQLVVDSPGLCQPPSRCFNVAALGEACSLGMGGVRTA